LRNLRVQLLEDRDAELERMDAQLSQSNQTLGKREAELQVMSTDRVVTRRGRRKAPGLSYRVRQERTEWQGD
jgi:hypothetical protein